MHAPCCAMHAPCCAMHAIWYMHHVAPGEQHLRARYERLASSVATQSKCLQPPCVRHMSIMQAPCKRQACSMVVPHEHQAPGMLHGCAT
eukprot:334857-Chlamydomonas_euryale.AAC.9